MQSARGEGPAPAAADDDLLRQAVVGDSAALGELLKRHADELARGIKLDQRWSAHFEVNDVLQVTFLEAFLRIRCFKPDGTGTFVGWLLTIARNNMRDLVRALNRAKRPPPDQRVVVWPAEDGYTTLLGQLSGPGASPSRMAAGAEIRARMDAAISRLPESYACVVRLYDLENLPIEQIAARLARSPNAVYMLRARAHDRLRELLGPESDFFTRSA